MTSEGKKQSNVKGNSSRPGKMQMLSKMSSEDKSDGCKTGHDLMNKNMLSDNEAKNIEKSDLPSAKSKSVSEQTCGHKHDNNTSLESSVSAPLDTHDVSDSLSESLTQHSEKIKNIDVDGLSNNQKDEPVNKVTEEEQTNSETFLSDTDISQSREGDVTAKFLFSFGAACLERFVVFLICYCSPSTH